MSRCPPRPARRPRRHLDRREPRPDGAELPPRLPRLARQRVPVGRQRAGVRGQGVDDDLVLLQLLLLLFVFFFVPFLRGEEDEVEPRRSSGGRIFPRRRRSSSSSSSSGGCSAGLHLPEEELWRWSRGRGGRAGRGGEKPDGGARGRGPPPPLLLPLLLLLPFGPVIAEGGRGAVVEGFVCGSVSSSFAGGHGRGEGGGAVVAEGEEEEKEKRVVENEFFSRPPMPPLRPKKTFLLTSLRLLLLRQRQLWPVEPYTAPTRALPGRPRREKGPRKREAHAGRSTTTLEEVSLSLFFSLSLSKLSRATYATLHLRERLREESGRCEKEKREAVLLLGEEKEAK